MTTETLTKTATPEAPDVVELPLESPPKPLKLSEAMRLGSIATTPTESGWTDGQGGTCAMSAAWYALTGGNDNDANGTPLVHMLEGVRAINPVTGGDQNIAGVIINLHDVQHWSRTQTADWLEGLGL